MRDSGHVTIVLTFEAKQDPTRPVTTILTVDHFKEIERFE